ncbi:UDP-N-acetylhexosamine pyrophosphorylase-like protein 1 [Oryzias melastigma]|uniref:UDP-N-acetylhexosamine pyrophosphorylase-like protein 1 n=1 Tax=Oryzias melastigma TaxID=30732 RepID=A0A834F5J0_ORYME|nr:UDP-N-acetylhexosamine pyrophosphorylase-like protein 1 [Oryzias melastigma]
MLSFEQARQTLKSAGQSHVLQFWPELSEEEKDSFLRELAQLDLRGLRGHCEGAAAAAASPPSSLDRDMEPIPAELIGSSKKSDRKDVCQWESEGLLQISKNRVGVLLLAGGQGTRLGVQYPKGMYDVGLPSGKTLYQIQAERIRKIQQIADCKYGTACSIPWYIMTSEFTLAPTKKFFEENHHFGLEPANIIMFEQRMIPAVTFDGKVIMQAKGKIAMAPDGNGGLYKALEDNKVLEDMKKRGVEFLHVYCVDNILVKMADPVFIGFCVSKGADCGAKVVEKTHPAEPVGVVCRVGGVPQVVDNFVVFEAMREEEFSPLKNADGAAVDSPTTARNSLLAQHCRWVLSAGATLLDEHGNSIPDTASGVSSKNSPLALCEISPLVSYFGEGLEPLLKGKQLATPFILNEKMAEELQNQS